MNNRSRVELPFWNTALKSCLLLTLFWIIYSPVAAFSSDIGFGARETVTGFIVAENGFAWRCGYDISLEDHHVRVSVSIRLIPHAGVSPLELERVKPAWEEGIEKIWSNRYAIAIPDGRLYPILIDVAFDAPSFHHQVVVSPGGGRSDQLNWKIMNSPSVAAHEFGHMLGAFDEYRQGATDPGGRIIDPASIMTSNPPDGKTFGRHYRGILSRIRQREGYRTAELMPIDKKPSLMSRVSVSHKEVRYNE